MVLPQDLQGQRVSMPALVRADMRVRVAREFGDRFMKLCAGRAGVTVDSFRARLLDDLQAQFAQVGMVLGPGLLQAMDDLYRDWGEVRLRVFPEKPLGVLEMMMMPSPQSLVSTLGLSLYVNDRPVPDLDFKLDLQLLQRDLGFESEWPQPESESSAPNLVRLTRNYEPVALAMLDQYIGSGVRIKPFEQPMREGTLSGIVNGEALVEQRTYGGKLTSYVSLDRIESAEVLVVKKTPLRR